MEKIIWYPSDFLLHHQWKFHNSKARIKILIGGWGAGKSLPTTIELINNMTIPQNMGFLGRYEIPELMQSVISDIIFAYLSPDLYRHNTIRRTITFKNYRSTIVYGFLNPAKLNNKRLGGSFGVICVDQMEEINEEVFEMLLSRLRREGTNRVFLGNANPNGKDWIWRRFIKDAEEQLIKVSPKYYDEVVKRNPLLAQIFTYETYPPYREYINPKEGSHTIVVSSWLNPFLPDDYIKSFLHLPEEVRKRFVEGEFTEFSGKIYNEFDEEKTVYYYDKDYSKMQIFVSIDPALQNYTAVLFCAYDGEILYVFDEIYVKNELPLHIITRIYEKINIWGLDKDKIVFLIDNASKKLYLTKARTIYMDYAELSPIPKWGDKQNLILQVKIFFANNKIKIHKRCENTIVEHNNYKWRKSTAKEEPLKIDDHTVDCLQYVVDEIRLREGMDIKNLSIKRAKEEENLKNENELLILTEDEVHERLQKLKLQRRKIVSDFKKYRPWRAVL